MGAQETKPIKAKTTSASSHAELLAEYREFAFDPVKSQLLDQRDDPNYTWKPVDYDPRFPNTDITRWCYVSFVDYYRCRKLRGDDYEPCDYFKNVYSSICPEYFVERWERWRADGTFLAGV